MAEDNKAEDELREALNRVVRMPRPKIRDQILWNALQVLCRYFKLEIVLELEVPKPNPANLTKESNADTTGK